MLDRTVVEQAGVMRETVNAAQALVRAATRPMPSVLASTSTAIVTAGEHVARSVNNGVLAPVVVFSAAMLTCIAAAFVFRESRVPRRRFVAAATPVDIGFNIEAEVSPAVNVMRRLDLNDEVVVRPETPVQQMPAQRPEGVHTYNLRVRPREQFENHDEVEQRGVRPKRRRRTTNDVRNPEPVLENEIESEVMGSIIDRQGRRKSARVQGIAR